MADLGEDNSATFITQAGPQTHVDESGVIVSPSGEHEIVQVLELGEGATLGKFVIEQLLGQGGMGAVYRGYDPDIDRRVAIKVLSPTFALDDSARQRFQSEGRAAGKLSHPNVVAVYDVGEQDRSPFLVMELVTGGSVEDLLDGGATVDVARATEILADACAGLAAAHQEGLVHRDIKPANLMCDADGVVKVADFGLARATQSGDPRLTQASRIVGTPFFMSPEQCSGEELDARSDLYSLGATYYALLTGSSPFESAGSMIDILAAHIHEPIPVVHKQRDDLPPACSRLIERAMAKSPNDRYATADEMLIDAEALLAMLNDPRSSDRTTYRGITSCARDSFVLPSEQPEDERTRTISDARSKNAQRSGGSSIIGSLLSGRKQKSRSSKSRIGSPKPEQTSKPKSETKNTHADSTTETVAVPVDSDIERTQVLLPSVMNPAKESQRREVYSLTHGEFVILCPREIASDELPELRSWLELVQAKIAKSVKKPERSPSAGGEGTKTPAVSLSAAARSPQDPDEPSRTVIIDRPLTK